MNNTDKAATPNKEKTMTSTAASKITRVPTTTITDLARELLPGWLASIKADPDFSEPTTVDEQPHCGVWLRGGVDVPCAAVAEDSLGNWTVLTADGRTLQYLHSEVE
jgi:hypothetical protein